MYIVHTLFIFVIAWVLGVFLSLGLNLGIKAAAKRKAAKTIILILIVLLAAALIFVSLYIVDLFGGFSAHNYIYAIIILTLTYIGLLMYKLSILL